MKLAMQASFLSVFPAYAGVIPVAKWENNKSERVPRVCGGDP